MSLTIFPESQLYQEVINGTYEEEPEIERLMEMRTLIDRLNIRVNLLGHHVSNTVPITGALPEVGQIPANISSNKAKRLSDNQSQVASKHRIKFFTDARF